MSRLAGRTVCRRADVWAIEGRVNKYLTCMSELQETAGHFSSGWREWRFNIFSTNALLPEKDTL